MTSEGSPSPEIHSMLLGREQIDGGGGLAGQHSRQRSTGG